MLMKKGWLKYIVLIVVAGLLAYNSVYFKKLGEKKESGETSLNPQQFAQQFWLKQFATYLDSAVEINNFIKMLKDDPSGTFQKYSKSQGIGNNSFFLVKGEGIIKAVNEDNVVVVVKWGTDEINVLLNTGIYFGNAVRDVTGKISMGDFTNTMDYNSVSTELNKIVRTQVVLPLQTNAITGKKITFIGCIEIAKEEVPAEDISILPVRIDLNNNK
jgi:predicted lipoprotein